MNKMVCSLLILVSTIQANSRLDWFQDAKLGIFIHWGIYSVDGISESWAFHNNYISHKNYMKQLNGFTAKKYDPEKWANLIESSGAKYCVLTTKHHDGVALWDTEESDLNVVKSTPAKQDLIKPLFDQLDKRGIKKGAYFSLIDWSSELYPNFTITKKRYIDDKERWGRFVKFYFNQLDEINNNYNPDLFWFDGDWEMSSEEWRAKVLKERLLSFNSDVVVNSRLKEYGDYDTPEQGLPIFRPKSDCWELCLTINDSWGYQPYDTNYKSLNQVIRIFIDCISMGGNLLLDIGPREDGTIPQEQVDILEGLGKWVDRHRAALFDSGEGVDKIYYDGATTLSKDGKTLYLFVPDTPLGGIELKGVKSRVEKISMVHSDNNISYRLESMDGYDKLWIYPEKSDMDSDISVVAVEFSEKLELVDDLNETISITQDLDGLDRYDRDSRLISDYVKAISKGRTLINSDSNSGSFEVFREWSEKHFEPLVNPLKGISNDYYYGKSTLSEDRRILYLYLKGVPKGPIAVKGIKNGIDRVRLVGDGTILNYKIFNKLFWSEKPGILYIDLPPELADDYMSVIAIQLDSEIDLWEK